MKTILSPQVREAHPKLEQLLWKVAVHAIEEDPDIELMGLLVQVRFTSDSISWSGGAWPETSSVQGRGRRFHPAGKILLIIGKDVGRDEQIRLISHELRHIGQFHRCRKRFGYLGTEGFDEEIIEEDAYAFEELILNKMKKRIPKKYQGHSTYEEILTSH